MEERLITIWQKVIILVVGIAVLGTSIFAIRYLPLLFNVWLSLDDCLLTAFTIFIFLLALGTLLWILSMYIIELCRYTKGKLARKGGH